MMNAPRGESVYNPDIVQSALRNAVQKFQQQTLALSESAGSAISSPEDATSPTGTTPGYYRHSRHSSLASSAFNTKRRKIIAFDLYGTLLSTDSITTALAKIYGEEAAPGIAKLWRRFQLEYTWRITSMGEYKNFHEITRSALGHALMEHSGIRLTAKDAKELMHAYEGLDTFPDVERGLNMLRDAKMGKSVKNAQITTIPELDVDKLSIDDKTATAGTGQKDDDDDNDDNEVTPPEEIPDIDTFIFTNGTEDMVLRSIATSPTLSPHARRSSSSPRSSSASSSSKSRSPSNSGGLFSSPESIVTVDSVQCYKPDPRCYKHLMEVAGVRTEADRRNVWVVSANPFDIVGAKAAGMRAAWIDREGKGWVDRLDEMRVPSVTATGVDEAIKAILSWK